MLRRPIEFTQYLSIRYTERLAEAGIESSVGSIGDSYDNALAESVIGLYKTEVIRTEGPWKGLDDVEFATLDGIVSCAVWNGPPSVVANRNALCRASSLTISR